MVCLQTTSSVQAAGMPEVWVQAVGSPNSKRSSLLRTDYLDMRHVARLLQYTSLMLQLSSQKMTDMPLDEPNAQWPLVELRQHTGHAGTEADPFLFSGECNQTGESSQKSQNLSWLQHPYVSMQKHHVSTQKRLQQGCLSSGCYCAISEVASRLLHSG